MRALNKAVTPAAERVGMVARAEALAEEHAGSPAVSRSANPAYHASTTTRNFAGLLASDLITGSRDGAQVALSLGTLEAARLTFNRGRERACLTLGRMVAHKFRAGLRTAEVLDQGIADHIVPVNGRVHGPPCAG